MRLNPLLFAVLSLSSTIASAQPAAPSPAREEAAAAATPAPLEEIGVGVYVNEVYALDLKASQWSVDCWVWFHWSGRGVSPLETFELVGGRVSSRANVIDEVLPDGRHYASVRINATIHEPFDLRRFPFDAHHLEIRIEDAQRDVERVRFTADAANAGVAPTVHVSGWRVAGQHSRVREQLYASNYGDLALRTGSQSRFSRYTLTVDLERDGVGRFFKFFFGLFIATLVAWCSFFVRPKDASPRVSASVGALFAASAVTISINNQLPDVGYVTLADKVVFLSMGMILVSLLGTMRSLSLHYAGDEAGHRQADRIGALVFPIVYVLLLVLIAL